MLRDILSLAAFAVVTLVGLGVVYAMLIASIVVGAGVSGL